MVWNKGLIIKGRHICQFCGKEFIRWKPKSKFCSLQCSSKSQIGITRSPETLERLRLSHLGKKLTEEQKIKIGNKSRGHRLSEEAKQKISLANSGSNGGGWKGGVSSVNELERKNRFYRDWRRSVFLRDEFTCQECGVRNVWIEAHHIKGFSEFPKLRFEIENGVTLCKSCHNKQHYISKE